MSQYLSNFYCGNKKNLCNYNKPIEYGKMLNRQFDMEQYEIVKNCKGYGKEKGYCCDPNQKDIHKPMDIEYMEHINNEFGQDIFHRNHDNKILDTVPLIKTVKNADGDIINIDVCQCGGEPKEYRDCVRRNCNDYKIPSRYEYCKMGSNDNTFKCFTNVTEEYNYSAPSETVGEFPSSSDNSPSISNQNNSVNNQNNLANNQNNSVNNQNKLANNQNIFGRCRLAPVDEDYSISRNFTIKNVVPDCYLNLCNKKSEFNNLENVAPNNYNPRVYNLGNNESMGFKEINLNNIEKSKKKTIADFLL